MRKGGEYKPPKETIQHVHELLQLMSAMTEDKRFEEAYSEEMEGSETNMCEVLDRIQNRGIEQGEEKMSTLIQMLIAQNRLDDLKRMAEDKVYLKKIKEEFFLNGN